MTKMVVEVEEHRHCVGSQLASSCFSMPAAPKVPLRHIRQLPLAVLACRSGALRTHTAVDHTSVALPVAIRSVVVRVGVCCARARLEKGGSRSVGNILFWVVADRAGTFVTACVTVVEEC